MVVSKPGGAQVRVTATDAPFVGGIYESVASLGGVLAGPKLADVADEDHPGRQTRPMTLEIKASTSARHAKRTAAAPSAPNLPAVEKVTIPTSALLLDTENPRHESVASQRDAILALIEDQGQKLVKLASDIAEYGMSPIDRLLVMKHKRSYVVVEGNRRIGVIKLLENPELATETAIERDIARIATAGTAPTEVDCAIAPTREAARHWLELRHAGEAEGAGVVRWGSLQTNRFRSRPGTQAAQAISFIDALLTAFPDNTSIQEDLQTIGEQRLTTLGRLVQDPNFKNLLGLSEQDGRVVSHYASDALEKIVERVLRDVATELTVTKLKTKDQRKAYVDKLPQPDPKKFRIDPQPLDETGGSPAKPKPTPAKRSPRPKRQPLFKDVDLRNLGDKIQAILNELRRLDLEKFPNAGALLIRTIVELAVDQVHDNKRWPLRGELKNRVRKCLHEVDPTDKNDLYQAVRTGLSDGTSLLSVATMHGYVHNRHYHPTASDLRAIASNYEAFLRALDDLV